MEVLRPSDREVTGPTHATRQPACRFQPAIGGPCIAYVIVRPGAAQGRLGDARTVRAWPLDSRTHPPLLHQLRREIVPGLPKGRARKAEPADPERPRQEDGPLLRHP